MAGRIVTFPADIVYEANWLTGPLQAFPPPWWTNITNRAIGAWDTTHGVLYEAGLNEAGEWHPILDNRDGGLDPGNTAGQYAPNVAPYKGCRIRMPFGVNQLTGDQASAGEQSGFLGQVPVWTNVVNDFGYPISIVASGSAFQGTQVYQAVLPSGATANSTVLLVKSVPVVPKQSYSFQAQARILSGNSTSTSVAILWFDANGNALTPVGGSATVLTSGSGTWTQLTVSGTAPAGAYSAWLKVQIAAGTLAANTTWQLDGLQWENSATPTPWQAPGVLGANLLPRQIATGLASINPVNDSAANWFAPIAGSVALATNLTAAPNGATTAVAWTTSAGSTSTSRLYAGVVGTGAPSAEGPVADCTQVTGGSQYTASTYLMRAASADATVQVTASIRWYDATGTVLSASTGAAVTVAAGSWIRGTVTANAPATAVWGRARIQISSPGTTTATNTIYATGWQLELAAAASTWVDPGPTYFGFWGYFEQFPQSWRLSGTWGETDAVGVDALAGLAQYDVQDPLAEEMLTYGASFIYPLNDPTGATSCTDLTGNRIPAPVENSPFGAGSLTFGNSVTATAPSGLMVGGTGPVATFNNNPSETGSLQFAETFISIHKTTVSPGPPPNGSWTRIIHFRSAAAPGASAAYVLWNAIPPSYGVGTNAQIMFQLQGTGGPAGAAFLFVSGATGGTASYSGAASLCDGNWHQLAISCDGSGNITFYVDGAQVGTGSITLPTSGIAADPIGASVQLGANQYKGGFVGDVAYAAEFPKALASAQITNLFNSFRSGSAGESSGARASRLLSWVGIAAPTSIDTGLTLSMGPATDLAGQKALNGFNAIVATENGDGYASNAGVLTFRSRGALYNSAPVFIFGERQQFGEWPYEDVLLPTDPIVTYNIVPVTQYSTGQVATSQDAASQQANFPRTFPGRTVNSTSFAEVQAASQYQLGQSKTPRMRCTGLKLHASAIPGLFAVCAQLEKGVRIRVMKRAPWRSTPIQFDGFVTRTEWSFDPKGEAFLTVDAAPADLATYWVLGALHTTLNAQAASGQAQATINALPDAAVNMLSQSLPANYQLVFEPGSARQETMTLAPTGIPATAIGYQSATLTFTGNFQFTHPATSVVCEPLPQGYTDPTTWDGSSVLGAASTTVVSGGGSGTNTITVGALPDSGSNALGSDWNVGDLLSISPGTAAWEGYNLLTPNQSTAGEGVLPLAAGTNGTAVGVTSALGTASVTASGTAFQGANVWQVPIGANASLFRCLRVNLVAAAPLVAHTWSVYVRSVTSTANPTVNAQIIFFDALGNTLSTTNGATAVLTGGAAAAWTRVTVTATAPAGTAWASLGVPLAGTVPTIGWNFQGDGLQWEAAAAASAYCTTPQVKSVASSVPGYTSVQLTLSTNLINTHAVGDSVCDWLPAGVSSPAALSPTTRLAY